MSTGLRAASPAPSDLVSPPALAQIVIPPECALDAGHPGREAHLLFLHASVLERADSDSLQLTAGGERDTSQLPAVPEGPLPDDLDTSRDAEAFQS